MVAWQPLRQPIPGCTAIIGVCSQLPDVLLANLRCLHASRWPELKSVVLAVDCQRSDFPPEIESRVRELYPDLQTRFVFYSARQAAMAESLKLPFVYSWLSWSIALATVETEDVLIHDYDALILGPTLQARYRQFVADKTSVAAKVQGISWYKGNGVLESDRLATTFEAFFDAVWMRSLQPIDLFHHLRVVADRSIDFDTTLEAQMRLLTPSQRTIMPMPLEQLVHPSQMIHQYTMFRRAPGRPQPCGSTVMIPFFVELGGREGAIAHATAALETEPRESCRFIQHGPPINLTQLDVAMIDWLLKQMVQVCLAIPTPAATQLYRYGVALYRIVAAQPEQVWRGDFTPEQRAWIDEASSTMSGAPAGG